jgi:hypothetical protein
MATPKNEPPDRLTVKGQTIAQAAETLRQYAYQAAYAYTANEEVDQRKVNNSLFAVVANTADLLCAISSDLDGIINNTEILKERLAIATARIEALERKVNQ